MPKRKVKCGSCDGTGEEVLWDGWGHPYVLDCIVCNGTGEIEEN